DRSTAPLAVVEVLHREMNAGELATGDRQVARHSGADREDDRVVALELVDRRHVDTEPERDTFGAQLVDTPLDQPLLDLELRHAEAHESAGRLVALVHHDALAGPRQLLGAGEPGRPGPDNGDATTRQPLGRLRDDPTLVPRTVDDRPLDLLDRDCVAFLDLEHAGRLTRRRAKTARELGEVVRAMELV